MRQNRLVKAVSVLAVLAGSLCSFSCGSSSTTESQTSSPSTLTLSSISVQAASMSVGQGATDQFSATGQYSNGTTQNVTSQVSWTSSNMAVATISSAGLATGVAAGTTTITAALNGVNGSAQLTVASSTTLTSISVQAASMSVGQGATDQFSATGQYSNGTTQNVTSQVSWASSNTAVATINSAGLATGVAAGTTTITASLSGINGSAQLTVTSPPPQNFSGVLTQHNDNSRTGQNLNETQLTPSNVNVSSFGKLFSAPVDGFIYAQPLYVPAVSIAGAMHNVVYVATEGDSVYAFDADSGTQLWHASVIDTAHGATAGETTGNIQADLDPTCTDMIPQVGITSTPVIDPTAGTIYVEAKSKEANGTYIHRLHMLDITTGAEKSPGPAVVTATVPGNSDGGTTDTFNALYQLNRPGLLLVNGNVYLGYGSHCDDTPYHGWLFAYNATTLAQTAVFITTPNGQGQGAIWLSGMGIAADSNGVIFTASGNGNYDATDVGDSVLKLTLSGNTLSLTDYFTPFDQGNDDSSDLDVASVGVLLLPDQAGNNPHELIAGSKEGTVFVINRDQLTTNNQHYCSGCTSDPEIVQEFPADAYGNQLYAGPTYWNGTVYINAYNDSVMAYALSNGQVVATPTSSSSETFGFPGVATSISANGTANGILWAVDSSQYGVPAEATAGPAVVHAYDATNLGNELWNSSMAANNRDQAGDAVKFAVPTIADGKVYVGTQAELDVYGLL
jgi:uncharacterized protein YjdB